MDLQQYVREHSTTDDKGCWLWTGRMQAGERGGYGLIPWALATEHGISTLAHRLAYTTFVGPIPAGLQIDHLCRVPLCCNPAHLEAVTPAENNRRSDSPSAINARKTHCTRGHPFDEANTYIYQGPGDRRRCCRACNREAKRVAASA